MKIRQQIDFSTTRGLRFPDVEAVVPSVPPYGAPRPDLYEKWGETAPLPPPLVYAIDQLCFDFLNIH